MKVSRTGGLLVLALLICLVLGRVGKAAGVSSYEVILVTADQAAASTQIIEGLRKRFPSAEAVLVSSGRIPQRGSTAFVAVGPSAFKALLGKGASGIIVSVFTSSEAFREIVREAPEPKRAAVTAVYAEPSPLDQLQLISAIYKRRVKVGVLLSGSNEYLTPILTRGAAQADLDLAIELVSVAGSLNEALNRLASVSVLLALPDRAIYQGENIRNILLSTYRRNQPLIGFSTAFVRAGALASTYSSIDDVSAQVSEVLDEWKASGHVPAAQFPKYFSVEVNETVARSLDVIVDERVRNLSRRPEARSR